MIGSTNEASPENQGFIGNAGFIAGPRGTIVINAGASYRHGRELLELAERVGGKPVVLAVITQPLPEFVMGSAAFAERGIPLLAHEAGARLTGERCERCLSRLTDLLGDEAMRGTRVVVPQRTVAHSADIEAGGRRLRLLHPGWGSTAGDLAVFDPDTGTLFAGALVSVGRVPDLRDADARGWLEALDSLQRLAPLHVVPGYGPPAAADAFAPMRDYLDRTLAQARTLQQGGASLHEALRRSTLPEFASWTLYASHHPRNIHKLYLEFENQELNR